MSDYKLHPTINASPNTSPVTVSSYESLAISTTRTDLWDFFDGEARAGWFYLEGQEFCYFTKNKHLKIKNRIR